MLKTRVERRELLGLTLLSAAVGHENARFMPRRQFNRLVENIRRDGTLTSAPLIGQVEGDERWYVISGNHRVEAAIAAGLLEADCVVVDGAIDQKRFVALQLSQCEKGDADLSGGLSGFRSVHRYPDRRQKTPQHQKQRIGVAITM